MRKRFLVLGAGLLGLIIGCASAHVASRDYQTGVFTVCGNKHADMNTLNEEAAKVCVGTAGPQILRCSEQVYGSTAYATGNSYGAVAVSKPLVGNCCDYHCPPVGGPTPPQPHN